MHTNFKVPLSKIISEFSLETLYVKDSAENIMISSAEVNRPGLHMAGYFEFFDENRIQIIGKSEEGFLSGFEEDKVAERLDEFFSKKPSAVIICRNLEMDEMIKAAEKYGVPLLRTSESTSNFTAA